MAETVQIVYKGRIPSKKNCRNAFVIKGRAIIVDNPKYRSWLKDFKEQLKGQGGKSFEKVGSLHICFYLPDRRKCDLTNKAESLMDGLVSAGVLSDDNYSVVPQIMLEFCGVDKDNPRAEIIFYEQEY